MAIQLKRAVEPAQSIRFETPAADPMGNLTGLVSFTDQSRAIRALNAGEATPEQQILALNWIYLHVCCGDENAYLAGERNASDINFILGRQYVGLIIRQALSDIPHQLIKPNPEPTK